MQTEILFLRSQSECIKYTKKFNSENKSILPDFSYYRLEIKEPTYVLPSTRINLSLFDLPKDKTPTMAYQKRFEEVVENKYKGLKYIYTDGFKNELGVGAAATTGNRTESASLPKFSSIFTAETQTKHPALITISAIKGKNFYIFTNSRSCLQAFQKQNPTNSKLRNRAHHSEPTEIWKISGALLERRYSKKRNLR